MTWNLDKKRPICPQICEKLCTIIASGELAAGDKLMSVRDVALTAGVTPNTVQKSFEQLEQRGIIFSKRGSGWYVTENSDIAKEVLSDLVHTKTAEFVRDMKSLGQSFEELISCVKEYEYE